MKFTAYTFLLFQLNDALGTGKYNFTIDLIKEKIYDRSIFAFLRQELEYFDDSYPQGEEKKWLLDQLIDMVDASIDYKLCSNSNGLSQLIAYLLELLQRDMSEQFKVLNDDLKKKQKVIDRANGIIRC